MPDFSKIWATNSPLPEFNFTDEQYLEGWDFVDAAPPTKTQFDAWFRETDKKLKWLYDQLQNTATQIYPVGSVYISFNSANPATLFGGVWQRLKDTFLLANGDSYAADTTGGSATKTITENNMPSHNHTVNSSGAHSHGTFTTSLNGSHTHTHGSLRIRGSIVGNLSDNEVFTSVDSATQSGALRLSNKVSGKGGVPTTGGGGYMGIDIDTNRANSWSGATDSSGAHTHTVDINNGGSHTHTTNNTGGGTPINIMPPYTTVYVWRRTA